MHILPFPWKETKIILRMHQRQQQVEQPSIHQHYNVNISLLNVLLNKYVSLTYFSCGQDKFQTLCCRKLVDKWRYIERTSSKKYILKRFITVLWNDAPFLFLLYNICVILSFLSHYCTVSLLYYRVKCNTRCCVY